jgi:hypothetical protein
MPGVRASTEPFEWDHSIVVHWLLLVAIAFDGQPLVVSVFCNARRVFVSVYSVIGSMTQASRLIKDAERRVTCGIGKLTSLLPSRPADLCCDHPRPDEPVKCRAAVLGS